MYGSNVSIRCLICMESGHSSHACARAGCKQLAFRSLSEAHLQACRGKAALECNHQGLPLSAAEHVGGGNVTRASRWFSCCRHDPDPALRWMTLTVDQETRRTRSIAPAEYGSKALAVLDLAAVTPRYDVSTPSLTVAHEVEPKWQRVAWESAEIILEHVPAEAVLAYWSLADVCTATPAELQSFCADADRWVDAVEACGAEAEPAVLIEWTHWYEFFDFVNGKNAERPGWLPM